MNTQQNTTNVFFLLAIIHPLEKIIEKLNKKEYSDNDIQYLDKQLDKFINIAAKSLYINDAIFKNKDFTCMNQYTYDFYIKSFSALLSYFQTIE